MQGKNRIREIMIRGNIVPKELAANAGMSLSELSRIMNHKVSPTFETMIMITKALDRNIWDIFYFD